MAARYLIIGASGFLGEHLHDVLGGDNAIGTYSSRPIVGGVRFDAATMRLADTVLKEHTGLTHAFIVHGSTGIDDCADDPEGTARINVAGTQRVIDDLVEHGIVPVFASSDAVFDGSRGLWTEEDPVGPILTYGRQKVEVERYLRERAPAGLVLRLAKVVSETAGAKNMLEDWLNQLEAGQTIHCATDQVFSPVAAADAVEAFVRLANDGRTGIFHVCGPRPVSRLQLLQMLLEEASRYRDLPGRIVPCSIRDFTQFAEARPLNNSMSPSKLYAALGRSFDDPRETCRKATASRYAGQAPAHTAGRSNAH